MAKSIFAQSIDEIQKTILPFLKEHGFKVRGRTFNCTTSDNLTQVINIQMGASDPPGTTYIPGLRENLYGLFTINLGIYIPEVARNHGGTEAGRWVHDYNCCIRARLGKACGEEKDIWWHARNDNVVIDEVCRYLSKGGIPFLERYSTRDKILAAWKGQTKSMRECSTPRIVMAIMLAERGKIEEARELLNQQVKEIRNPRHPEFVRALAEKLKLGQLEG